MGGSSSQVVGYKYYAGLQVVIGNCIEYMININPDNRGWIFTKPEEIDLLKTGDASMPVNKPNLFGGDKAEGGWVGIIDIHTGKPETLRQNEYLAAQDSELVSSFPYLSHVVFRGPTLNKGFQLVSMSGMLKEVLYWPKRTRIKDDGAQQWYDSYTKEDGTQIIVCEIEAYSVSAELTPEQEEAWLLFSSSDFVFSANVKDSSDYVNNNAKVANGVIFNHGHYPPAGFTYETYSSFAIGAYIKIVVAVQASNLKVNVNNAEILSISYLYDQQITMGYETYKTICTVSILAPTVGSWSLTTSADADGPYMDGYGRVLTRIDFYKGSTDDDQEIAGIDINPVHQIREIITNDTAMNKPESMINDENFKFAARRIWDERLGVSGAFTEKSCKDAIDELLYHIEAGIRINRQTGKYEIVLFRDDLLSLNTAHVFNKSNIKTFNIEIANIDDVINSVNVNYYDRENIKDSSFSLDEIGSVMSSDVNAQTLDFPYFMNRRNAELVGNWKLKQLSTPTRKGTFTTGKYEARKINRYDVVKLTWANQNMFEVPVRIMKIGLGDGIDNTVTLDWVEVIPYSSINYPSINVDPSTSVVLPPQPAPFIAFEVPYYEAVQNMGQTQVDAELANNPDAGFVGVAALKPQNNSINALLYTDSSAGYSETGIVNYAPSCVLDQNIGYLDTTFAVKNVTSLPSANTAFMLDDEIMVFVSFDAETGIMTVKRGALDTVPQPHLLDSRIWFYDEFPSFDSTEYVISEVVNAKVLTTTPSGILDIAAANEASVTLNARAIRPYPPADVKINDEYYPLEIESDLVVTWVDRNRLQQTGGSILGWTDGGVALESAASTMLTIKELDVDDLVIATHNINATGTNTYTLAISAMQAETRSIEVTAKTVRDGYESYQYFQHIVLLSTFFTAPYNITYTVREF